MLENQAQVSVIIVTYNSSAVIENALRSITRQAEVAECFVVDNASTDNTLELIEKHFPQVKIIKNSKNLGFGVANNQALEIICTPYALLLNPDADLAKGALPELIKTAEAYPDVAIIAPLIVKGDGTIQHSYKRNVFEREKSKDIFSIPEGDICAEFISGAVLLLKMEHMKKIGFFDPDIFLFYEDDDLCLRTRFAGYSLVLTPQAKAMHLFGQSSPATAKMIIFKQKHMAWSRFYLERKYNGGAAGRKLVLKILLISGIKTIIYCLLFKKQRRIRHYARFIAASKFLCGKNC